MWFLKLNHKEQMKVAARLQLIEESNHFGDVKVLKGYHGLCELRWANGWRVYFVKDKGSIVLLLQGGHKNDQKKDIEKAHNAYQRYSNS